MAIHYLSYHQIDKQKWDACIDRSVNQLIYAKSFYLDAMAANWDALVLNDFEAVMPLNWKNKWGIKYLYQPAFTQQGGVFFTGRLSAQILQDFIDTAATHFKFAEVTFNHSNDLGDVKNCQVTMRNNYVLSLEKKYEDIYADYPGIIIKNLKRANKLGLHYHSSKEYLPVLQMYKHLYAMRLPSFSTNDFSNFAVVCQKLSGDNNLIIRNVTGKKNELLAAVVLLKDQHRLYNIISCVTGEGRIAQANYFLYDQLIQEFCNSDQVLDFEGSDVKGIADFYSRFHTSNEMYPFVKINHLHPLIRLIKH